MNVQERYLRAIKRRNLMLKLQQQGIGYKRQAKLWGLSSTRIKSIIKNEPPIPKPRDKSKPRKQRKQNPVFVGIESWRKHGRDRTRYLVRHRDDFTCQSCFKKWRTGQRQFDVHHLNGLCGKLTKKYDSSYDMSGLITLCHKCHYNHPEHTFKRRLSTPTPPTSPTGMGE